MANQVEFQEKDVAEDHDARDELIEKLKSNITPTIVVDGDVIVGFRRDELNRRLGLSPTGGETVT